MGLEKKDWLIADMYYPSENLPGSVKGHEAICVLNPSDREAHIQITLYFEDRPPMELREAVCGARRTNHIRMDLATTDAGEPVPQDTPYAALVHSDVGLAVQYSRADARQQALAMMTTMAYPV